MIASICSKIVGATLFALAILTVNAGVAQAGSPSFDCAKASEPDERVICGDVQHYGRSSRLTAWIARAAISLFVFSTAASAVPQFKNFPPTLQIGPAGAKTGHWKPTPLKQGMQYVEARKALIDAGWQAPVLPAYGYDEKSEKVIEECSGDVAMCNAFPEIRNCSGQGYCVMEFTNKAGDKLEVTTYGELSASNSDATVTGWQRKPSH
jgi:hypothetical protein